MAVKPAAVEADIPNDDTEGLSADEQAALDDRSTVGQTRRVEEAEIVAAEAEPVEPKPAAKPEEKPAAEAKPDEKGEAKHVPLATLLEERKEFQRKLEDEATKRAELSGKLDLITQRLNQPKPVEQPKPINIQENPIAALEETRQQLQQVQHIQVQQAQRLQFANHVAAQVNQFKSNTADYDAAYKFAVDSTKQELKARGYSDAEIPAILENGEFQLAQEALQRGKNPGQHFYEFAQARGYKKAELQSPADMNDAIRAASTPTAEQRIETANRGQAASKSLSNGGSPPPAKLTLADLEGMSENDIADMPEDKFRALFG